MADDDERRPPTLFDNLTAGTTLEDYRRTGNASYAAAFVFFVAGLLCVGRIAYIVWFGRDDGQGLGAISGTLFNWLTAAAGCFALSNYAKGDFRTGLLFSVAVIALLYLF